MSNALNQIDEFKRTLLRELLQQCTIEQQEMFGRMYKSVEDISEDKIPWALQQCERTIEKNRRNNEKTCVTNI